MPERKHLLLSCWAVPHEAIACAQPSFLTVFILLPICTAVWHFSFEALWHEPRFVLRICSVHPDLRPGAATLLLQSLAQMPVWIPLSAFHAEAASLAISHSGAAVSWLLIDAAWCAAASAGDMAASLSSARCCEGRQGATQMLSRPSKVSRVVTVPASCDCLRDAKR